jgi:hypothetical protein
MLKNFSLPVRGGVPASLKQKGARQDDPRPLCGSGRLKRNAPCYATIGREQAKITPNASHLPSWNNDAHRNPPLDLVARPSTTVTTGTLERPPPKALRVYQAPQFTEARLAAPQPAITKAHGKDTKQARSAFRGRKNGRRYEPVGVLQSGYVSRWLLVPRLGVLIRIDQTTCVMRRMGLACSFRNVRK